MEWTSWEKVGLVIIFIALGVLIVWLTFAFWPQPTHGGVATAQELRVVEYCWPPWM